MKNLTPRQQWFYALFAVGLFAIILGWTVETETMLFWTLIALTAVSIWQMLVVPKERPMTPEETDLARIDTLKARLDRYRLSLSALPEGVILIRRGMTLEWCNPAAERHLGVNLEEHQGIWIQSAIDNQKIRDYLHDGVFDSPILVASHEEGHELLLRVYIADETHVIIVTQDVTEHRRIDAMRKDFVANVSHELRTPLTVITGFLDMILHGDEMPAETRQRQLELMKDEASRMQSLVNDLLALSRLENSNESKNHQPDIVSMSKMVKSLYEEAKTISNGFHRISVVIDTDTAVEGYANELRSACLNLITNALRYTPRDGEIEIRWTYDERRKVAVYSVKDNGIGIAAKDIPRLTERFYRVDKSRSRETGGTGLGLAIVKHVAMNNHAELKIESELGKGSTFSLEFPALVLIR